MICLFVGRWCAAHPEFVGVGKGWEQGIHCVEAAAAAAAKGAAGKCGCGRRTPAPIFPPPSTSDPPPASVCVYRVICHPFKGRQAAVVSTPKRCPPITTAPREAKPFANNGNKDERARQRKALKQQQRERERGGQAEGRGRKPPDRPFVLLPFHCPPPPKRPIDKTKQQHAGQSRKGQQHDVASSLRTVKNKKGSKKRKRNV